MQLFTNSRVVTVLPDRDRRGFPILYVQSSRLDKYWEWDAKYASLLRLVEGTCMSISDDKAFTVICDMEVPTSTSMPLSPICFDF
jgi:hypothetical protein